MIHLYILQSLNDNGYYIGICKDLVARLNRHNRGLVESTKHRIPFRVIYVENFDSYESARVREKEIKSYKGGFKFKRLVS